MRADCSGHSSCLEIYWSEAVVYVVSDACDSCAGNSGSVGFSGVHVLSCNRSNCYEGVPQLNVTCDLLSLTHVTRHSVAGNSGRVGFSGVHVSSLSCNS